MSDSDPDTKKTGVPSWQLKSKDDTLKAEVKEVKDDNSTPSRETVIQQAKKFLEEDEVRTSSTDKKIAFLEGKGLRREEIEGLLGITRNLEASSASSSTVSSPPPTNTPSSIPAQQPTYTQPHARDAPPIITYPEFLTTPPSPSPLITKTRLLTTLYLFSGLSALLYGTNTYLLTPMLQSLTTSRLSLAETSKTNLSKLITKLEEQVSEIPPTHQHHRQGEEEESEDEDPSEMFHRDIGVQTSTPTSRTSSPSPTPHSVLEDQTSRLQSLKRNLSTLIEDSTSEGNDVSELESVIGVLREYLDGLAYATPTYGFGGVGSYGGTTGEKDDEISRVKAGIRGVKGVLLSAKSFPGGVRAGGGR